MPRTTHSKNQSFSRKSGGFTLLELMIGIVVGLSVLGTVAALFVPTLRSFRQGEAISQIQENQRYGMRTLATAVDQAGYVGCDSTTPENVVTTLTTPISWASDLDAPVRIYSPNEAAAANVATNSAARRVVDGAPVGDVLTLLTGDTANVILLDHDAANEEVTFSGDVVSLLDEKMIMVNDCSNSALFEIAAGIATTNGGVTTTTFSYAAADTNTVSYTHLTLPTNREV